MSSILENELRMFWQCSLDARRPQEPLSAAGAADLRDELETLAMLTDWPRLREACVRTAAVAACDVEPARMAAS
jgi:hypothetical protein